MHRTEPGHVGSNQKDATVVVDNGLLELVVSKVIEKDHKVECIVQNQAMLGQTKKIIFPGINVEFPALTTKDMADIQFAIKQRLDFIALTYVRKPDDILRVRDIITKANSGLKIIAKIEHREALNNFDEILKVSDGIMIARGDLGVEIPIEQVSIAQKMMIRQCNAAGKPVITAMQMLDSMIKNPSPTRAEASDVANAVLDGTDCVMLSGETAKGLWPVESVTMMADICREAEWSTNYRATYQQLKENVKAKISVPEAIASSAVKASFDLEAAVVVVLTESGNTARLVSKYRPSAHIITITSSELCARQCLLSRGLFPLLVSTMSGSASLIHRAILAAENLGMCKLGDLVVVTSGTHEGVSGATNDLKVIQVTY
jgi:pyruvate kinase